MWKIWPRLKLPVIRNEWKKQKINKPWNMLHSIPQDISIKSLFSLYYYLQFYKSGFISHFAENGTLKNIPDEEEFDRDLSLLLWYNFQKFY
jgi:hypothetical protein